MFGSADFIAQSATVHGAFDPWSVLLWLALMLGCLLAVAGVVALARFVGAGWRGQLDRRPHGAKRGEAQGARR